MGYATLEYDIYRIYSKISYLIENHVLRDVFLIQ